MTNRNVPSRSSGVVRNRTAKPAVTFEKLRREAGDLAGHERLERFAALPVEEQESAWETLAWKLEGQRLIDGEVDFADPSKSTTSHRDPEPGVAAVASDDPLRLVPPPAFVEVLTGEAVPASGMLRCPLPGHDDRTPSFKVYPGPGAGVWCFGCGRGGDIYSFAAALWDSGLDGLEFVLLRRRIATALLDGGFR